jgi:hypothetical protein
MITPDTTVQELLEKYDVDLDDLQGWLDSKSDKEDASDGSIAADLTLGDILKDKVVSAKINSLADNYKSILKNSENKWEVTMGPGQIEKGPQQEINLPPVHIDPIDYEQVVEKAFNEVKRLKNMSNVNLVKVKEHTDGNVYVIISMEKIPMQYRRQVMITLQQALNVYIVDEMDVYQLKNRIQVASI